MNWFGTESYDAGAPSDKSFEDMGSFEEKPGVSHPQLD
jgi:hypothetical protein